MSARVEELLATNYVLIDFENVQPKNLQLLADYPFKVLVFVGAHQTKVPYDLANALQSLGANAQYIKITGSGKNALDFHVSYYIGDLAAKDPKGCFHIISKDTGFDPLVKHLRGKHIQIQRHKDLAEIPVLRISNATSNDEKIGAIIKNVAGRGHSRPRKVKTLANTINSLFTKQLSEAELQSYIQELENRELITVNQGNVSYKLPR